MLSSTNSTRGADVISGDALDAAVQDQLRLASTLGRPFPWGAAISAVASRKMGLRVSVVAHHRARDKMNLWTTQVRCRRVTG